MARDRFLLVLVGGFAAAALLLAGVGVYGVTAQAARRRTREIGIRLALGAPRERVLAMVLREVGTLGAWGLGVGLPLAKTGVERMQGDIGVDSEPGKGAKFWIALQKAAAS